METQKTPKSKAILRRKTELEELDSLTSDYTIKLQYGTSTKTNI